MYILRSTYFSDNLKNTQQILINFTTIEKVKAHQKFTCVSMMSVSVLYVCVCV